MNLKLLYLSAILILTACTSNHETESQLINITPDVQLSSAELFKIEDKDLFTILTIYDKSGKPADTYYLVNKDKEIPGEIREKNIIRTPLSNVICLSTTHIAFIDMLNESDKITAVSGSQYIFNPELRKKINSGKIKDVGYENSLDFEILLKLKPDVVTVYDINNTISPVINKIKKFNIPIIQINEYLESSALSQAEWIKFFAELFHKREPAEKKYQKIKENYEQLLKLTDTISERPSILLNMPWKGTWYIPGGRSNIAQLIKDAGGLYIWEDEIEQHNIPLNIEDVYLKASDADIWLNPGQALSVAEITGTDTRLNDFKPVKDLSVYNRIKRIGETGGNDYMESGTVRPDLILKDLIKIFYPELLPEHTLFYYSKLE